MSYLEAFIVGLVQGISEFLPISSTAHIILAQRLLGLSFHGLFLEVFLHLASVLALVLYFRKDIFTIFEGSMQFLAKKDVSRKFDFFFALYILLATFVTGVIGVLMKDFLDEHFKSSAVMGSALIVTGAFLVFIERFHRIGRKNMQTMGFQDALLVGLGQAVAVLPGISRSGSTLIAALWVGLDRATAIRYSFLLAIPVILGSSVLMFKDLGSVPEFWAQPGPFILSFWVSFAGSCLGIMWLIRFVQTSRLLYFAIYCFVVGSSILLFLD